jgi:hypothetical protein
MRNKAVVERTDNSSKTHRRAALRAAGATILLVALTACEQHDRPRTYYEFMEDGFAREGVLVRCNQDREATANDVECVNARRAAAAVGAQADGDQVAQRERESERKMIAMRDSADNREQAAAQAAAQAEAEQRAAYDAQWRDPAKPAPAAQDENYDPFAVHIPERIPLEVAAVAPPKGELEIVVPDLEIEEVATIPRPFRANE